ncbi:hypothetical protein CO180_04175 [candidate division WWE3 bacterium CG_4_9_14_3_um_filter_41_6]|uniref:Type II secretion system protein GspG C-terminal domain-containing protein n=1 Tax=candidate division WWE3 bacterium CG_4_10_14_0_2_um_filter_41_14 TaxID=1975072 RepID=A0A2M7TK36_UNCKA|nr:MAG: hypothetical protein COY32_02270 [candidate division WWE3 bacterium CG_4_10_14_0_2_um_filter_41_14]PJA38149.1 MAG: hypothetical protein CO180_04175 [candidate division WWE3 bacterium CG_4_9_14_3_um_filter_41_6]
MNKHHGFTLIELLVVIVIIGLLASIGIASFSGAIEKAKIGKVTSDLKEFKDAIARLGIDTGKIPTSKTDPYGSPRPISQCTYDVEFYLNSDDAGLLTDTTNRYPNWSGPYLEKAPLDPWGVNYYYDPDYACHSTTNGCEDIPDGRTIRAILSAGPNNSFSYGVVGSTTDPTDNIVVPLCIP